MAATPPMYRIDRSNRGNLRMRSQQNPTIYPGTQIVHEKPLIGLNSLVDALDVDRRHDFDRLHNSKPLLGFRGIILTNAFSEDEDKGPLTYRALQIYSHISRINHSCNPNAEIHWNYRTNTGSVRALRPIQLREEICVSYLSLRSSLWPRVHRQAQLQKQYGFQCTCDTCSKEGAALVHDDAERNLARKQLQQLIRPTQAQANDLNGTLARAQAYAQTLGRLGIRCTGMPEAYEMIAQAHKAIADDAAETIRQGNVHCAVCNNQDGATVHLKQAVDPWWQAYNFTTLAHGLEHPQVEKTMAEINKVLERIHCLML